jgi:type IV secretory pathway TrbL component
MGNKEQTGKKAASAAAKVLRDPGAPPAAKSAAGSALTQHGTQAEQTSKKAASSAAKVLRDPKSSTKAKSAAASTLTQRRDR